MIHLTIFCLKKSISDQSHRFGLRFHQHFRIKKYFSEKKSVRRTEIFEILKTPKIAIFLVFPKIAIFIAKMTLRADPNPYFDL